MKSFRCVITDEVGIHARPAGLLAKEAKNYQSRIEVSKGDKRTEATKLMGLMGLGVKCGDEVEVRVEGPDEETACENMKAFFRNNF